MSQSLVDSSRVAIGFHRGHADVAVGDRLEVAAVRRCGLRQRDSNAVHARLSGSTVDGAVVEFDHRPDRERRLDRADWWARRTRLTRGPGGTWPEFRRPRRLCLLRPPDLVERGDASGSPTSSGLSTARTPARWCFKSSNRRDVTADEPVADYCRTLVHKRPDVARVANAGGRRSAAIRAGGRGQRVRLPPRP